MVCRKVRVSNPSSLNANRVISIIDLPILFNSELSIRGILENTDEVVILIDDRTIIIERIRIDESVIEIIIKVIWQLRGSD